MPHSRASNSQPLSCPELKLVPADQPEDIRAAFVNSPMLSFCQQWRSAPGATFQEGSVSIGWHDDSFFYFADLQDSHPHSRSTDRNQQLWLLGDVFEVFAGIEPNPAYIEFHTSPNGHTLHLLWPDASALAQANASDEGITPYLSEHTDSASTAWSTTSGWSVYGRLSSKLLTPASPSLRGQSWNINFGRYDYPADFSSPTISATSPLTHPHFHRRSEWHRIKFV